MYSVLSVGVNNGLQFAEQDALDIEDFYKSAIGPAVPSKNVESLIGPQATRMAIANALYMIELDQPEFFVFFFSGHGSKFGIQVDGGIFSYKSLIQCIKSINARSSLVILDTCYSGVFKSLLTEVAGVDRVVSGWLGALAKATSGSRLMLSTGPNRPSSDGGTTISGKPIKNGLFTYSLLEALKKSRGNIPGPDGIKFVSDKGAFKEACQIMQKELGSQQVPVESRLRGDLPMARSQHNDPVGDAEIIYASGSVGVSLQVKFCLKHRRSVRTLVDCILQHEFGGVVAQKNCEASPSGSWVDYTHTFEFESTEILQDPLVDFLLWEEGRVPLTWILIVKDEVGNPLDQTEVSITYYPQR
jgi:hypothetical protein